MKREFHKLRLLDLALTVVCVAGLIGFAFGFTKHFPDGKTPVLLPIWPNAADSVFIILAALYLGIRPYRDIILRRLK